jgi:hypothetical protein
MQLRASRILASIVVLSLGACSSSETSGPGTGETFHVTTSSLPAATVGVAYAGQLASSGGTAPVTWAVDGAAALPAGLALEPSSGAISGTPTSAATYAFTVTATDSASPPRTASASLAITVHPAPAALVVTTTSLPNAIAGVAYEASLIAGGGAQPYAWTIASGGLPPGITLASDGTLSGQTSVTGTFLFTVQVTDGSSPTRVATASLGLTVLADSGSLQVTTASLPGGTVDSAYVASLSAAGGTSPYAWSVASGALPPGLSLDEGGAIAGIPTAAATYTFVVQVIDAADPAAAAQRQFTISIGTAPLTITTVSLPNGVVGVPYLETIAANGGATPYSWSLVAGALPDGLELDESSGIVAGTPTTSGGYAFTVQVTDSSDPQKSASQSFSVTIASASQDLVITTTGFGDGVVGLGYGAYVSAVGGTTPYTWSVVGSLPPGLTLDPATGQISGTPGTAGSYSFTIHLSDSSTPKKLASAPFTIKVYPPLQVATASLPTAVIGAPYAATIEVTGGLAPYGYSLVAGSLPPGLLLSSSGTISGTPSGAGGSYGFSVQVTDSANPKQTTSGNFFILVEETLAISTSSLPSGLVGAWYSEMLVAVGGTPPCSWAVTAGALPPELALDGATGAVAGLLTEAGEFGFTVVVTDSVALTASRSFTIQVTAPTSLQITTTSLPGGTLGGSYAEQVTAIGGLEPYAWSLAAGQLPPGLKLDASTGEVSGTPSLGGTYDFVVQVVDSSAEQQVAIQALSITIASPLIITTTSLPNGSVGVAYSATVDVTGGIPPYAFAVTWGALPGGLALDGATGVIAGTPIAAGTSSFRITVTDVSSPQQSATRQFTIQIVP